MENEAKKIPTDLKQLYELGEGIVKDISRFWGITQKDLEKFKFPSVEVKSKDSAEIDSGGCYDPETNTITLIKESIPDQKSLREYLTAELTHSLRQYLQHRGILGRFKRLEIDNSAEEFFEGVTMIALHKETKDEYRKLGNHCKRYHYETIKLFNKSLDIYITERDGTLRVGVTERRGEAYAEKAFEYLHKLSPEERRKIFMYPPKEVRKRFFREEFLP